MNRLATLVLLPLILIAALLTGCASFRPTPDIVLVDIGTGQATKHPSFAPMRQVIVSVDDASGLFRTVFREGDHLVLRTLDYDCRERNRRPIPLFKEGYCGSQGWRMAPNADRLVYLKQSTRDLCLIDLASSRETVLCANLAKFDLHVPFIRWLSDSEIVMALLDEAVVNGPNNQIVVVDTATGAKRTIATPVSLGSFDYALSPNCQNLAYWECKAGRSVRPDERINVLDVKSGRILASLAAGKDEHVSRPCWSPDGRTIGYFCGKKIMLYSLDTQASRTLATLGDDTISYALTIGQGVAVYHGGKRNARTHDWDPLPLTVYDLQSGKPIRSIDIGINGDMVPIAGGRKLLCETGF